jgi:hypothetical protein
MEVGLEMLKTLGFAGKLARGAFLALPVGEGNLQRFSIPSCDDNE